MDIWNYHKLTLVMLTWLGCFLGGGGGGLLGGSVTVPPVGVDL